jgi:serine/threonine protein kinase
MIGTTVGRYRVVGLLGSGGMGEVYEAEDPSLGRVVALKILPRELADDRERRARFEREAKVIAALDHPGIVTVHAVEEHDGRFCLVMERIRGRTLAELLPATGLPLEKVLEYAVPLVGTVAAAHERGVIHRDLKPQNVMVTDDGRVKVLDFGIARRPERTDGDPELAHTATATAAGKIFGTIAYMSPEQARGLKVDARSDIFSLGVVLFELATGTRPFAGEAIDLAMAIVSASPPAPSSLVPSLPKAFDAVVARCLEKDPARRYANADELERDLERLRSGAPVRTSIAWRKLWPFAAAALAALPLAAWRLAPKATPVAPRIVKLTQLTFDPAAEDEPSLSPDGSWLVYTRHGEKQSDIHRLRVGGENAMNLTADSADDDEQASISPDGEQIVFRSERQGGGLFIMGATGESVRRLTDGGYHPSWSPDGRQVLYSTQRFPDPRYRPSYVSEIWALTVATGEKKQLREADAVQPVLSPHGQRLAFWGVRANGRDLMTAAPDGSDLVALTDDVSSEWSPSWSHDGASLYFSSDRGGVMNVWRLPMDETSGRPRGIPQMITSNTEGWSHSPLPMRDGNRLVYVSGVRRPMIDRVAFDAGQGAIVGSPQRVGGFFAGSADAEWVYGTLDALGEDVVMIRGDGSARRRLTNDAFRDRLPRISPDGKTVAFLSRRETGAGIFTIRTDGSALTQVTPAEGFVNGIWSPDGKRMAVHDMKRNAWIIDMGRPYKEQTPEKLPPLPDKERYFRPYDWSPDGRYLVGDAAAPNSRGPIWIYDFKQRSYRLLVDGVKCLFATWLPDSRRLVYVNGREASLVDLETGKSRLLWRSNDRVVHAMFSSDWKWLYFERDVIEADLWLAQLGSE